MQLKTNIRIKSLQIRYNEKRTIKTSRKFEILGKRPFKVQKRLKYNQINCRRTIFAKKDK